MEHDLGVTFKLQLENIGYRTEITRQRPSYPGIMFDDLRPHNAAIARLLQHALVARMDYFPKEEEAWEHFANGMWRAVDQLEGSKP